LLALLLLVPDIVAKGDDSYHTKISRMKESVVETEDDAARQGYDDKVGYCSQLWVIDLPLKDSLHH